MTILRLTYVLFLSCTEMFGSLSRWCSCWTYRWVDSTDDVKQRTRSNPSSMRRYSKTNGFPPVLQMYIDSSKVDGVWETEKAHSSAHFSFSSIPKRYQYIHKKYVNLRQAQENHLIWTKMSYKFAQQSMLWSVMILPFHSPGSVIFKIYIFKPQYLNDKQISWWQILCKILNNRCNLS